MAYSSKYTIIAFLLNHVYIYKCFVFFINIYITDIIFIGELFAACVMHCYCL